MTTPRYTIVVCHYNMAQTVDASLRSILTQIGDEYELLVIDGGSDDGSIEILRQLSEEFNAMRIISTAKSHHSGLAAERNLGVSEARGDHVLLQLDADDEYDPVIEDFVYIYEQVLDGIGKDIYFSGSGINIAPREFLLSYGPYREGIHRGEDSDMWRRLLADGRLIHVNHEHIYESVGYDDGTRRLIEKRLSEIEGDFRSGVTIKSRVKQAIQERALKMGLMELLLIPLVMAKTLSGPSYNVPAPFDDARVLTRSLQDNTVTVPELEAQYEDINIDWDQVSERGQEAFA